MGNFWISHAEIFCSKCEDNEDRNQLGGKNTEEYREHLHGIQMTTLISSKVSYVVTSILNSLIVSLN